MFEVRWFGAGGSANGPPARRLRRGSRLVLVAVGVVAFALDGCSMLEGSGLGNGCHSCGGGCGGSPCSGLSRFNPFRRRDRVYGPEVGGAVIGGAAPAVVTPGAVVTPAPAPAPGDNVPELSPAPADEPPATGPSGRTNGAASKSSYQTYLRARPRAPGAGALARALPPLEPAPGPAPRGGPTLSDSLLDSLPAPDAVDATPRPTTPDRTQAISAPKPATSEKPVPSEASPKPDPTAAIAPPPALPPEEVPASVAIGIARFKAVDSQLAGGSFPSAGGWAWLSEKSYRTVLDLREPGQLRSEDVSEVARQGLRHVILPVTVGGIDGALMARFNRELAQADARPLYFCDADGTRAAVLWYVHRIAYDKIDRGTALRDAQELAPIDAAFLQAANAYLDRLEPRRAASAGLPPTDPPARPDANPSPRVETLPMDPTPAPVPAAVASDPTAWRPYAALLLSLLGVPCAYWSRGLLSFRTIRRASLPGPRPRPKALLPSSGA